MLEVRGKDLLLEDSNDSSAVIDSKAAMCPTLVRRSDTSTVSLFDTLRLELTRNRLTGMMPA